jgi:lysophospholipase L1-like esterase
MGRRGVAVLCGLACVFSGFGVRARGQGDPARAFDAGTAAARKPGTVVRVDLVGDSTQTDNAGYGRGFCANLTAKVDCINMAKGGASTGTYRAQGLWDRVLATKPDYVLMQFGHNDLVTPEHLDRQVPLDQYAANLKRFVSEARAAHITPILVTPLSRRTFGADGKVLEDLKAYGDAMRGVARETKTPLIDLQAESIAYVNKLGEVEATKLGISKKDAEGTTIPDRTHLNWRGSFVFGRMVAVGLGRVEPGLRKYVRTQPAVLPVAGVKAMAVYNGGPVTIVLVGDSTVASEGGWGPGFCAAMKPNVTCIDDAKNGRSTKSFLEEGLWAKALAEKGDYYFIQFGHNDQKVNSPHVYASLPEYEANLKRMIADVRAIGGVPVIVTSLSRRTFVDGKVKEDLNDYAEAARGVAAEDDVTCVDLNRMSTRLLNTMTQAEADGFDATAHADAKAENAGKAQPALDRTHLNAHGQQVFGRMVADEMVRTLVELGPDVMGVPAKK